MSRLSNHWEVDKTARKVGATITREEETKNYVSYGIGNTGPVSAVINITDSGQTYIAVTNDNEPDDTACMITDTPTQAMEELAKRFRKMAKLNGKH